VFEQRTSEKTPKTVEKRPPVLDAFSPDDVGSSRLNDSQMLRSVVNNSIKEAVKQSRTRTNTMDSNEDIAETVKQIKKGVDKEKKLSWAGRAFSALDTENRGYLLKHELLDHFYNAGIESH
jgi:hypothetical protein